ncbi:hypothetical protein VMCG_00699 [Cytospora schulzeri]|uniref:Uncharacterized protein n=1 Tax=Cytospora schulzeri TaxID=448051 RepID=A0A423X8T1_9PEZI|nr:hypothetical protein VMCG_00699 [Valsa malicola]
MPDFKNIAKNGWHPEKNGGGIRNRVGAALGRENSNRDVTNYNATPLDQLRDPSTFAPPPKRLNSGVLPPPQLSPSSPAGAAAQAQYGGHAQQEQGLFEEETSAAAPPPAPPRPYRVDTTGLSTAHLPPPPGRLDGADGRSPAPPPPPPYSTTSSHSNSKPAAPPSLPPRLPPRTNSASPGISTTSSSPAPELPGRQSGYLNQGAVDRLGGAGVSVPGLGISSGGGGANKPVLPPPPPSRSSGAGASPSSPSRPDASPTASAGGGGGGMGGSMSEIRSRFSKFKGGFGGSSSPPSSPAPSPAPAPAAAQQSQGTTWAQKQSALRTMSDFKKDPRSVSYSDARSAASTANNFRERHGEQVAAGVKTANSMDQKYGVSGKVGGYMGNANGGSSAAETGRAGSPAQSHFDTISSAAGGLMGKKKPPPPPPKKKPALSSGGGGAAARDEDAAPPVPMATRPF